MISGIWDGGEGKLLVISPNSDAPVAVDVCPDNAGVSGAWCGGTNRGLVVRSWSFGTEPRLLGSPTGTEEGRVIVLVDNVGNAIRSSAVMM